MGGKFWSKNCPVTRDAIYERPLIQVWFRNVWQQVRWIQVWVQQ